MSRRALALACLAALVGCELGGSPFDRAGVPVAWVDDEPVLREDLPVPGSLESVAERRDAIDGGIADLLAAREARRRGLGYTEQAAGRIAAVRRAAEIRERRILRDVLLDVFASEVEIDERQLRADFEQRHAGTRHRHVTLRALPFPSREAAESANAALGDSGRLDPARSQQIGPVLVRKLSPDLRDAARRVRDVGERAVVEIDGAWSLVELVDQQVGETLSFEDAREAVERNLRRRLAEERLEQELARMRDRADVRIDSGALANDRLWVR